MKRSTRVFWTGLFVLMVCGVSIVLAQGGDAAALTDLPVDEKSLWAMIKKGGPLMFVLFPLCAAAIALSIYGFISVPEKKMLTPEVIPEIEDALKELDIEKARDLCAQSPSLLTNILASGFQRVKDGVVDVEDMNKAMEEASVEETSAGLKMISYINILAQLAPMVGLLGTVTGMIKAFEVMSKGGMGDPNALSASIGEAMVTTASGLFIGIPAMFLFFHLKGRYMANVARIGRVIGNLMHRLSTELRRSGDNGEATPVVETAAYAEE